MGANSTVPHPSGCDLCYVKAMLLRNIRRDERKAKVNA